ncbi:MAG: hypothetical protein DMG06_14870 [Acidobacteria bacterium]|nr:MAG: hypothetical protein DMG06_14870 [Acidobacteriota bacterium]
MERKYRQHGYMDRDREEKQKRPPKPHGPKEFRSKPMPGFREVFKPMPQVQSRFTQLQAVCFF